MKFDTISRLDAEFAEFPIMRALNQPSEEEISRIEQLIGVPFPDDYKQFILLYGGAMVGAYPVFGLRPVEVMGNNHWSILDVTEHYRANGTPGTNQWAIFSEDHSGNPIGMDKDGVIWTYDHDFGGTVCLANDFEDCIRVRFLKLSDGH